MAKWNFEMQTVLNKIRNLTLNIFEMLGVICVLVILGIIFVMWGFEPIIHSRSEQVVPDLQNKSVMAALDVLAEKKLAVRKAGVEFDSSVPVGAVIRQIPSPNTTVREGKIIKIWLSQGGEAVFAPNLIGLPLRNANVALRQKQLILGEVTEEYSLMTEKGLIINQTPKPDENLSRNTMINISVSAGIPPANIILMPDFRQKKVEETKNWSSENSVRLKIVKDKESVFPNGTVIAQSPTPDTVINKNSSVTVTVSGRKSDSEQRNK
ncbi:MAG TPA: PASTA domain-containing protein, partial [Elusimicrobiales bacterium]|nr:PASTA domain-containing protein [Elusimicrobiales bacterium]